MKRLINILLLLMFAALAYGQTNVKTNIPPNSSKKLYFATAAMTDSVGSQYSANIETVGFLPQDLYAYSPVVAVAGTGTADSVAVIIQGRNSIPNTGTVPQYTPWTAVDTAIVSFNKVDGIAYFYSVNLNGARPDQIRIQVKGQSTVNRSNVVIKTWLTLIDQTAFYYIH